jgi:type II secretory pathway component PulL
MLDKHEDSDGFIYFRKKELKTKHLKQKAEKKAKVRMTRSRKLSVAANRQGAIQMLRERIKSNFSMTKRSYSKDGDLVSRLKKLESQINQILS